MVSRDSVDLFESGTVGRGSVDPLSRFWDSVDLFELGRFGRAKVDPLSRFWDSVDLFESGTVGRATVDPLSRFWLALVWNVILNHFKYNFFKFVTIEG
jgi:hypothetical protein